MPMTPTAFDWFVVEIRPNLARAFAAAYGLERGRDALAEASLYAWEHADRVRAMDNPAGYLWRVGQSRSRARRRRLVFPPAGHDGMPEVEPKLPAALASLSERQRTCVLLTHAFGWTHQEVADLLGLSRSSVQVHSDRGLRSLRAALGEITDA